MGDWNEVRKFCLEAVFKRNFLQIARLPQEFQKQCVSNSRARYDLQKNGTVSVTNECQRGDGSTDVAEGAARLHDKNEPAKFDVSGTMNKFFPLQASKNYKLSWIEKSNF